MIRGRTIASLGAAFVLAAVRPTTARGAGAVVGKQGEAARISSARIAVATSTARSTWWAQVSVEGASAGFVWLLPVRPGARVDLGSDAWLDALDAATAPVVLPPASGTFCDAGFAPELVPPTTSPQSTRPTQTVLVTDAPSLDAFVGAAGYALPPELAAGVASLFASGVAIVASSYDSSTLPTRTVRVVDGGPSVLPFSLSGSSVSDARVTAFAIAASGASAGTAPLSIDPSGVLWANDGTSTYVQTRDALLAQWQGTRWLTESALPDLFFDGAPIVAATSLPPVLGQYFALATAYGDATGDPAACTAAAYATRTDSTSYVATCPAGALGVVPGPSPCPPQGDTDGGTPVDALLCGGSADDAALAVAGFSATDLWVTRIDGLVTLASASDVPVSASATPPSSPVVTAGAYASTCDAPPSVSASPSTPAPAAPPEQPSAQPSSSTGSQTSDVAPAVAEGCGSAIGDACSSSDSSDDDDHDSGGCDSSEKSDDDTSSGGCGSSDSSSSSSSCTTGQRAHAKGRSPVSRIVLLLAAVGAVSRRRWRPQA